MFSKIEDQAVENKLIDYLARFALPYSNSSLILKKKVLHEFYHEFLLKLHNGRISLARLNKLVDKLWGSVKIMTVEIWQSRNNHKYDKKLLLQQTIISKINAQLKTIILAHFQKHKLNDTTCKKIFYLVAKPR